MEIKLELATHLLKKASLFRSLSSQVNHVQDLSDFANFAVRYQKAASKTSSSSSENRSDLARRFRFPPNYQVEQRVCFTFTGRTFETFEKETKLKTEEASYYGKVFLLYMDFLQRNRSSRILKIARDRFSLPITKSRELILSLLSTNDVVIVAGDTGCGKSTQVPQFLLSGLQQQFPSLPRIVCTQPRRIACMSLCQRVKTESLNEFGDKISYQIRFESSKSRDTRILFVTEGVLLRQFSSDSTFSQYDIIICDEVHEHHLFGDFLLAILKNVVKQREGSLKLILMSATINLNLFSNYFEGRAPIVQVPGRLYPIDVQYWGDAEQSKSISSFAAPYLSVLAHIAAAYTPTERGDVLVFLPGIREIVLLSNEIKKHLDENIWIVLPLHSALAVEQQQKVFDIAPTGTRKVVLATNIAETSITIDGIRFVIDSGKVKEMVYDPSSRTNVLSERWESQASAAQRKGRAGRTGPGTCFRMYGKTELDHFLEFAVPEIQRLSLESVVLQIKKYLKTSPKNFDFLEPPSSESIEQAIKTLQEKQALESAESEDLTILGQILTDLPVDPSVGKVLVFSTLFNVIDSVLVMTASMAVQTPFLSPEFVLRRTKRNAENEALYDKHAEFRSAYGDPFSLLILFHDWMIIKDEHKLNSKKWCRERDIEEQRLYEITKLVDQFKEILNSCGFFGKTDQKSSREERKYYQKQREELRKLQSSQVQSRRFLSLTDNTEDDEAIDYRDIDFALSNNFSLCPQNPFKQSEADFLLQQLALCSGLYPNVAVGDESNSFLPISELVYHTRTHEYASMHPSAVFAKSADAIQKNDVLFYFTLLHTNKTYITSTFRVPSLPFLLLFCRSIDTNSSCTTIIVDEWLEFNFPSTVSVKNFLIEMHFIREQFGLVLAKKYAMVTDSQFDISFDAEENSSVYGKRKRTETSEPQKLPKTQSTTECTDFSGGIFSKIRKEHKWMVASSKTLVPKELIQLIHFGTNNALEPAVLSARLVNFLSELSKTNYKLRRLRSFEIKQLFGESAVKYSETNPNDTLSAAKTSLMTSDVTPQERSAEQFIRNEKAKVTKELAKKAKTEDNGSVTDAMLELEMKKIEENEAHGRASGCPLNDYFWYGSIPMKSELPQDNKKSLFKSIDEEDEVGGLRRYVCLLCNSTLILTLKQLEVHLAKCQQKHSEVFDKQEDSFRGKVKLVQDEHLFEESANKAKKSALSCDLCGETQLWTPIELLKHRKTCKEKKLSE